MNKKIFLIDFTYNLSTELSFLFYKVKAFFVKNRYNIVNNINDSDYILICTYGYLSEIEKELYNYIIGFNNNIKNKKIIIFGDLGSGKNSLKNIDFIYYFIPSYNLQKINDIFEHNYCIDQIFSFDMEQELIYDGDKISEYDNSLYFLEISSGCAHNCNFCHIKKNIGYVKSKKLNDLINQFKYAVNKGYKYIILLSEDAGSYGLDIGIDFAILLDSFCSIEGNYKINIHYIYPSLAIKYQNSIIKNINKIHKFLMPIQSFNNRILKNMNRNYKVEDVILFINKIKKNNPNIIIYNHIIYGYPTESLQDFIFNIKMSDKYYSNTIFIEYSYIEGTKKYSSEQNICNENKKKRKYILFKLIKKYRSLNGDNGINKINVLSGKETYEMLLAI